MGYQKWEIEVENFKRKLDQIEALKSNLLWIGNKEARFSFLSNIKKGSLGNFFNSEEKLVNEIKIYFEKAPLFYQKFLLNFSVIGVNKVLI
jgi:hypothetical protein